MRGWEGGGGCERQGGVEGYAGGSVYVASFPDPSLRRPG